MTIASVSQVSTKPPATLLCLVKIPTLASVCTHESLSNLSCGREAGREGGDIKHSGVKLELVRASRRNVPRNCAIYIAEKICSVMVRCMKIVSSIFSLCCIT